MHKEEPQFCTLIYEYFLMRIKSQYYQHGDVLPPIDVLYKEFSVSPQTVREALRRLRSEGYISMHNGQNTRVIFQQNEQELADFILSFYSERWGGFTDLYRAAELVLVPLLVEGLRRMDEEDLAYVTRLAAQGDPDALFCFYGYTLQKTANSVALNLFWEVALYQGFPFTQNGDHSGHRYMEHIRDRLEALVSHVRAQDWSAVQVALTEYQRSDVRSVILALEPCLRLVAQERQIPFLWRLYRDRPQYCYDLGSHILHHIYFGEYSQTPFLPSYEKMAEKYGVSVSTMRRTISLLNQIGATRSINGKGTRAYRLRERSNVPDYESPIIRRILSYYLQSLEMVVYSIEGVTLSFLAELSGEESGVLVGYLEKYRQTDRCVLSMWCMILAISKRSSLSGVREIYQTIYSLFLWGMPLLSSSGGSPMVEQVSIEFTDELIRLLKAGDISGCAKAIKALVTKEFPAAEKFLLSHGLRPEELRLPPPIRLPFPDEL